jgi:signal transduction histidine kinase
VSAWLTYTTIRTRLLLVYLGVILVGFSILTVNAGGQINTAVRAEYEQHLQDEIRLIAQGVAPFVVTDSSGKVDLTRLNAALANYDAQTGGKLVVFSLGGPPDGESNASPDGKEPPPRGGSFFNMPEMETALRGEIVLVERKSESGVDTFYTAAPVGSGGQPKVLLQLAVPSSNLQGQITQRWAVLGLGFVAVTLVALAAALWLSRSIIQPLYRLRESAVMLSQGDLSHRIEPVGRDEIGEVAQAFNEMARQLQSMLEEQRAFASNTAHELRTPLTAIRLRTEALVDDTTLDAASTRRYTQEIADEAMRLSNLVEDLTLLSRFDAGRAGRGQDEIDFARLAANLVQQYSEQAKEKGITLALHLPDEPVPVKASLSHLNVVFRNILDNAIKYTPSGGRISWRIQKTANGVLHTIQDTGQGISAQDLPHLYERFYRADKAHSRNIPGTGLGLALVKSIVDAYNSQITIESEGVGKGSTVNILWTTPDSIVQEQK